jgi:acyl-CoA hydrolase
MSKGETSCVKVTEAVLTYVAIDEKRRPKQLPEK